MVVRSWGEIIIGLTRPLNVRKKAMIPNKNAVTLDAPEIAYMRRARRAEESYVKHLAVITTEKSYPCPPKSILRLGPPLRCRYPYSCFEEI